MRAPKSCWELVCFSLLLVHSASQAQLSFNLTTVASPGDAVPIPRELVSVSAASMNDNGQVAFTADGALFLQSSGTTNLLVGFGDPAPGGGYFIDAYYPVVNASGQIVFGADLAAPGRSGLFVWAEGSTQSIVQTGDPAPGGGTFLYLYESSNNALGDVVFHSSLDSSDDSLFLFSQSTLSLVARAGDPAPRGDTFFYFYNPVININRQIAFASFLPNTGIGIFLRDADGTMRAVIREGDPAPAGVLSEELEVDGAALIYPDISPTMDDAGAVAFSAAASIFGRGGIFLFSNGEITRRVREGDPAPGGGTLSSLYLPVLNSAGAIAFESSLSGTSDTGVFLLSVGVLAEVARPRRPSPEGDRFTNILFAALSLNAAGQVTLQSELENSLGGAYLFSNGAITRIVGQGDPIDREPKILNARPEVINAAGGVVFRGLSFPGGEELFDGTPSTEIVRFGDSALTGGVFDYFSAVATNDSGQSIFVGHTSGGSSGVLARGRCLESNRWNR